MQNNKNIYPKIYSIKNLFLAWKKAKKGKTKKQYVIEFEKNLVENLIALNYELKYKTYKPNSLVNFIIKDPKTRKISKSAFKDRIVHHALVRIIEPVFDKTFIYDSCANRKNKGTLFALNRFKKFQLKITKNLTSGAFCLKADIKHYFQEISHEVFINIIKRKIKDKKVIWLIIQILKNCKGNKGIPLGNLTSQFFANIYLHELDYFAKHKLKAKYYIRYVDDFVILHKSKSQLEEWKKEINDFLINNLKLELHEQKSRIINLSRGIDFVGFRNFYYYKLLRKRNIKSIRGKIELFNMGKISNGKFFEVFQGWFAYAKWASAYNLVNKIMKNEINLSLSYP